MSSYGYRPIYLFLCIETALKLCIVLHPCFRNIFFAMQVTDEIASIMKLKIYLLQFRKNAIAYSWLATNANCYYSGTSL